MTPVIPERRKRAFTEEDVEAIGEAAARAALKQYLVDENLRMHTCLYSAVDPGQHEQDHDDIREIINFFRRVNEMKWVIPKTVIGVIVTAAVIAWMKWSKIFQ